jgi:hypothetical protein
MSNEEVTQVSEVELGSQDAGVLRSRVEAYTKQRDELLQKAQALHGEVEFCNRMLDIIGENGTVEEE